MSKKTKIIIRFITIPILFIFVAFFFSFLFNNYVTPLIEKQEEKRYLENSEKEYNNLISNLNLKEEQKGDYEILFETKGGLLNQKYKEPDKELFRELNINHVFDCPTKTLFKTIDNSYTLFHFCTLDNNVINKVEGSLKEVFIVNNTAYIIYRKPLNSEYHCNGNCMSLVRQHHYAFSLKINKPIKNYKLIEY